MLQIKVGPLLIRVAIKNAWKVATTIFVEEKCLKV